MKIIEAGWNSYRKMVVPRDASAVQVAETRQAFYAGASIMFTALTTMNGVFEEGDEPTEADLQKMADLQAEVAAFGQEIDVKLFKTAEH